MTFLSFSMTGSVPPLIDSHHVLSAMTSPAGELSRARGALALNLDAKAAGARRPSRLWRGTRARCQTRDAAGGGGAGALRRLAFGVEPETCAEHREIQHDAPERMTNRSCADHR